MKLQNHHEFYQLNHRAPRSHQGESIGTMKLGKIRGPQLVRIQRPLPGWARAAGAPLRACHDLALGQMPVPHDAPAAVVGFQIGGRGQKPGHFRLNRLNQKRPRAIAQNLVNRSVRVRHDIGFQFSSSKKRLNSLPHPANACSARFLSTKAFMDFAKRSGPNVRACSTIDDESSERDRIFYGFDQIFHRLLFKENPGAPLDDRLGRASFLEGDDGTPARHRFDGHDAKGFLPRKNKRAAPGVVMAQDVKRLWSEHRNGWPRLRPNTGQHFAAADNNKILRNRLNASIARSGRL